MRHRPNHRVVVTGIGALSNLGIGLLTNWQQLLRCVSPMQSLTHTSFSQIPCRIAGRIPEDEFQQRLSALSQPQSLKHVSRNTLLAVVAAEEALHMAKWRPHDEESMHYTGISLGMGLDIVSHELTEEFGAFSQRGYRGVTPRLLTRCLGNMPAAHLSLRFGLKGPNKAVNTACATSLHAVGDAARMVSQGEARVMLAGGTDSGVTPFSMAAFSRIRAMAVNFNENPQAASRPFDSLRDGFVMSEGACVLLLEELQHALDRGATPLAELLGYGMSGDAHHLTAPDPKGDGAFRAMQSALVDAQVSMKEIGYVNAHATSTPLGDAVECAAIDRLMSHADPGGSSTVPVSSTKGSTGHLMAASGALELAFTCMACEQGVLPPTCNLHDASVGEVHRIRLLGHKTTPNGTKEEALRWDISPGNRRLALKNSYGFGGTNASVCVGQFIM